MTKIEIYDPPMCCSTGICGASADPILVTFASDLEWLKAQGVNVVRHGLSLEPTEFVKNENVKNLLNKEGNASLPIIVIEDKIVAKGYYPARGELAQMCSVAFNDDEAPAIHREENCCCGVDCDCSSENMPEGLNVKPSCDCSNAPAEDNCYNNYDGDEFEKREPGKLKRILLILAFAFVIAVILAARFCCKVAGGG